MTGLTSTSVVGADVVVLPLVVWLFLAWTAEEVLALATMRSKVQPEDWDAVGCGASKARHRLRAPNTRFYAYQRISPPPNTPATLRDCTERDRGRDAATAR
jgi:hypothetical protein